MLALDIDGTLLNTNSKVSPRTRRAIEQVSERDVTVVLVTGRRFGSARPIALDLELSAPLVTHNGALTKNSRSLEIVDHRPLPRAQASRAIRFAQQEDLDLLLCDQPEGLGRVIVEEKTLDRNQIVTRYLQYVRNLGIELQVVADLSEHCDDQIIEVLIVGTCRRMDTAFRQIRQQEQDAMKILRTVYPSTDMTIVDCLAHEVSKAAGLHAVAERFGIAPEEIMAIGDNHNDLEMLELVGLPVIMGNAEDELKTMGFTMTGTNDEDGVAVAIEHYLLQ